MLWPKDKSNVMNSAKQPFDLEIARDNERDYVR